MSDNSNDAGDHEKPVMSDAELMDFLVCMKRKARRSGHARRVSYTQAEREKAIKVLDDVDKRGGSVADAADMMGMHTSTLMGWLKQATEPDSDWRLDSLRVQPHRLMSSIISSGMCDA